MFTENDSGITPPVSLENPPPSEVKRHLSAWELPELKRFAEYSLEQVRTKWAAFPTCLYQRDREAGTRNFKPQRFLGSIEGLGKLSGQCPCGRAGHRHVNLGSSAAAAAYPDQLVDALAEKIVAHLFKMGHLEWLKQRQVKLQTDLSRTASSSKPAAKQPAEWTPCCRWGPLRRKGARSSWKRRRKRRRRRRRGATTKTAGARQHRAAERPAPGPGHGRRACRGCYSHREDRDDEGEEEGREVPHQDEVEGGWRSTGSVLCSDSFRGTSTHSLGRRGGHRDKGRKEQISEGGGSDCYRRRGEHRDEGRKKQISEGGRDSTCRPSLGRLERRARFVRAHKAEAQGSTTPSARLARRQEP